MCKTKGEIELERIGDKIAEELKKINDPMNKINDINYEDIKPYIINIQKKKKVRK